MAGGKHNSPDHTHTVLVCLYFTKIVTVHEPNEGALWHTQFSYNLLLSELIFFYFYLPFACYFFCRFYCHPVSTTVRLDAGNVYIMKLCCRNFFHVNSGRYCIVY